MSVHHNYDNGHERRVLAMVRMFEAEQIQKRGDQNVPPIISTKRWYNCEDDKELYANTGGHRSLTKSINNSGAETTTGHNTDSDHLDTPKQLSPISLVRRLASAFEQLASINNSSQVTDSAHRTTKYRQFQTPLIPEKANVLLELKNAVSSDESPNISECMETTTEVNTSQNDENKSVMLKETIQNQIECIQINKDGDNLTITVDRCISTNDLLEADTNTNDVDFDSAANIDQMMAISYFPNISSDKEDAPITDHDENVLSISDNPTDISKSPEDENNIVCDSYLDLQLISDENTNKTIHFSDHDNDNHCGIAEPKYYKRLTPILERSEDEDDSMGDTQSDLHVVLERRATNQVLLDDPMLAENLDPAPHEDNRNNAVELDMICWRDDMDTDLFAFDADDNSLENLEFNYLEMMAANWQPDQQQTEKVEVEQGCVQIEYHAQDENNKTTVDVNAPIALNIGQTYSDIKLSLERRAAKISFATNTINAFFADKPDIAKCNGHNIDISLQNLYSKKNESNLIDVDAEDYSFESIEFIFLEMLAANSGPVEDESEAICSTTNNKHTIEKSEPHEAHDDLELPAALPEPRDDEENTTCGSDQDEQMIANRLSVDVCDNFDGIRHPHIADKNQIGIENIYVQNTVDDEFQTIAISDQQEDIDDDPYVHTERKMLLGVDMNAASLEPVLDEIKYPVIISHSPATDNMCMNDSCEAEDTNIIPERNRDLEHIEHIEADPVDEDNNCLEPTMDKIIITSFISNASGTDTMTVSISSAWEVEESGEEDSDEGDNCAGTFKSVNPEIPEVNPDLAKVDIKSASICHSSDIDRMSAKKTEDTPTNPARNLKYIIEELLTTERNYIEELRHGIKTFISPFDRPTAAHPLPVGLLGQKYHLFGTIERIYDLHANVFLPSLLQCKRIDVIGISEAFCRFCNHRSAYMYVLYFINSKRRGELSARYRDFFEPLSYKGLDSFLAQPLQRLPRYLNLLRTMMDELVKPSLVAGAKDEIAECCRAGNHINRLLKRMNSSVTINDIVDYTDTNILQQGQFRFLHPFDVYDCLFQRRFRGVLFLFDKGVLVSEQRGDANTLLYRGFLPHHRLGMIELDYNCFALLDEWRNERLLELITEQNAAVQWMTALAQKAQGIQQQSSDHRRGRSTTTMPMTLWRESGKKTLFRQHRSANSKSIVSARSRDGSLQRIPRWSSYHRNGTSLKRLVYSEKHFIEILGNYKRQYLDWMPSHSDDTMRKYVTSVLNLIDFHGYIHYPKLLSGRHDVMTICKAYHAALAHPTYLMAYQTYAATCTKVYVTLNSIYAASEGSEMEHYTNVPLEQLDRTNAFMWRLMKELKEADDCTEFRAVAVLHMELAGFVERVRDNLNLNSIRNEDTNFEEIYGLVEVGAACFMLGFETRLLLLTKGLICVLARISTKTRREKFTAVEFQMPRSSVRMTESNRSKARIKFHANYAKDTVYKVDFPSVAAKKAMQKRITGIRN